MNISDKLLNLYNDLLRVYTERVTELEYEIKKDNMPHGLVAHLVINDRCFTPNIYLKKNDPPFYIETKDIIIPRLLHFLAIYENVSDTDKNTFDDLKPKTVYQEYLDELYSKKLPFLDFLESKKKEQIYDKADYKVYHVPKKISNKLKDKKRYEESLANYTESINQKEKCIQETKDLIKLFNEYKNTSF